mmetsp:Transcript_31561/g.45442  ORF Transcript_31561/g.45442 Transcript_31561/m.45442 type:complete len:147 (-) Transcript_31561:299-739(-)
MISSDSNIPLLAALLISAFGSIMKGTVRMPSVILDMESDQPNLAPGQGLYSTIKSNIEQASRTFLQNGEASYSYIITGFSGRLQVFNTVEESLSIPSVPGQSPSSGVELCLNGVHPTTKTPVASLNANAIAPVIAPLKSPFVMEKG